MSSVVKNTMQDFVDYSSIHGVRYIGEKKRSLCERILWSVMFLLMLAGCKLLIFDAYVKWTKNPIIVSFANGPTPNWHIPFPAVTICPETKADASKFNITEMYHRFAERKDLLYDLSEQEISRMTAFSQICDPSVFGHIDPKNMTDCAQCADALRSVAVRKSHILAVCYFEKILMPRDDWFDEVITEEGICYTFNGINVRRDVEEKPRNWTLEKGYTNPFFHTYPLRAMGVGREYSLYLFLGLCTYDFDYICRKSAQGFKMLVHTPTEVPQISKHFYRIPFKQDVMVVIKPRMISTSDSLRPYPVSVRQCYFEGERHLQYFTAYTQRNCELECLANQTQLFCGCTLFYMPKLSNSTKVCGTGEIFCIKDSQTRFPNCGCLPSCTSITYDAEITQAESNLVAFYAEMGHQSHFLDNCPLTQLRVYFKEQQFIPLLRSEFYGMTDFVSKCGCLLGLFLAVSLMSLVEIVYFCSVRLVCSYLIQHRQNKSKLSQIVWVKPALQEFKKD